MLSAGWKAPSEQREEKSEEGGTCKEPEPCFLRLRRSSRRCLRGMSTSSTTPGVHCTIWSITSSGTEKFSLCSTFLEGRHRDGRPSPSEMKWGRWGERKGVQQLPG